MSDSDDPSRSNQPEAQEGQSDEESAAASSEGEGVDLRPGQASPSDSSEEEDDDSEAEREVRKGQSRRLPLGVPPTLTELIPVLLERSLCSDDAIKELITDLFSLAPGYRFHRRRGRRE